MTVFSNVYRRDGGCRYCLQQTLLGKRKRPSVFLFLADSLRENEVGQRDQNHCDTDGCLEELLLRAGAWYQDRACKLLLKKGEESLAVLAEEFLQLVKQLSLEMLGSQRSFGYTFCLSIGSRLVVYNRSSIGVFCSILRFGRSGLVSMEDGIYEMEMDTGLWFISQELSEIIPRSVLEMCLESRKITSDQSIYNRFQELAAYGIEHKLGRSGILAGIVFRKG